MHKNCKIKRTNGQRPRATENKGLKKETSERTQQASNDITICPSCKSHNTNTNDRARRHKIIREYKQMECTEI